MKLLLTRDVPNLGREGELREVADGYARNYLLPRGLAVPASRGNIKLLQEQREALLRKEAKNRADLVALAERLRDVSVTISTKTGTGGRLYGSITSKDIGDALEEQHHLPVDRRMVELDDPIRTIGTHKVRVRIASDLHPEISVVVQETP
ncbi:MAG: 50S ribosomal protein L9 [Chloroflexi bacterium]|nr:50S ribosomal protein L9 [Chloroflexota bacterium]